jgi:hypothetical protein
VIAWVTIKGQAVEDRFDLEHVPRIGDTFTARLHDVATGSNIIGRTKVLAVEWCYYTSHPFVCIEVKVLRWLNGDRKVTT